MNFHCADLVVPERISRLGDPEHSDWHRSSLRILFEMFPDKPCLVDAHEGPDYFEKYEIPIPCDACSPSRLQAHPSIGTRHPLGKDANVHRYSLDTQEAKRHSTEWIRYCDKPILIWICDPAQCGRAAAIFKGYRGEGAHAVPDDAMVAILYSWDSPQMELISVEAVDISSLLQHGWSRRKSFFRQARSLPGLSKIFDLDIAKGGIWL